MLKPAQALLLRLSLHYRIAVFVSGILVAFSLAFGYVAWEAVNRSTDATLEERQAIALEVAGHLDDLISHAHNHLLIVAHDLVTLSPDLQAEPVEEVLADSHNQLQFFFTHLLVFGPDGRFVASAPSRASVNVDGEARAILDEAARSGEPAISNLLHLPVEGTLGVLFVAPIKQGDRVLGVVAAEMRIPHPSISSVAGLLQLGRTGHMEVMDGRRRVIAATNGDDVGMETEHPTFYGPLLEARQSAVGLAYGGRWVRSDGTRVNSDAGHVMAFVPLRHVDWGVGLGQTETETFAATIELRDRAVAVAAIALIVALLLAWVGTRSVVHPIRALTRAGERMATGDLSEPIPVTQSDEVGRLAQVMEAMRQRLDQSLAEIRAWNQDLEERVHIRTGELEARNRHLRALMAVATATSRRADRQEVLPKALQELGETLEVVAAWAFLWDERREQLQLVASYRLPELPGPAEASVSAADTASVIAGRSAPEASRAREGCPSAPVEVRSLVEGTRCWCAPVRVGEECLGALCLAVAAERTLQADELALLRGIAQEVAIAFENARLTEERTRLEAAQRMELLRAEFLASVSHELRTPLGFVKGYSTTLLREDVKWKAAQRREFLQIIDEECDRLTRLVDSLLDAARAHAGRLQLQLRPVSLAEVINHSVERMSGLLTCHPVQLAIAAAPSILADESRLEQVIVNLLQNAVKYSPDGGPIEVRLRTRGEHVHVSVLDQGIGIRPADLAKVFEPFYQAPNVAATSASGAGLGLTICRSIVEAHGGRIWAEARPGGGTAVHFTLPVRESLSGERSDEQEVRAGN